MRSRRAVAPEVIVGEPSVMARERYRGRRDWTTSDDDPGKKKARGKKEPEGPPARWEPKLPATFMPLGLWCPKQPPRPPRGCRTAGDGSPRGAPSPSRFRVASRRSVSADPPSGRLAAFRRGHR